MKATASESTAGIMIRLHTPIAADEIRIAVHPGFKEPTIERRVEKPRGVQEAIYRWDLKDVNGKRIPPGYYGLRAERGGRGQVGFVHVLK